MLRPEGLGGLIKKDQGGFPVLHTTTFPFFFANFAHRDIMFLFDTGYLKFVDRPGIVL